MSDNAVAVAITVLHPDWRSVASLAVDAVSSGHSQRAYQKALKDFHGLVLGRSPAADKQSDR